MGSSNENEKQFEGVCERCSKSVYSNQLFVEEKGGIYHLSCYNHMKKEEEESKGW